MIASNTDVYSRILVNRACSLSGFFGTASGNNQLFFRYLECFWNTKFLAPNEFFVLFWVDLATWLGFRAWWLVKNISSSNECLFILSLEVHQISREQMKRMWDSVEIMCPYCGEFQQTDVDISAGSQEYWQDCQVCCCPILFELTVHEDREYFVTVKRDDE